MLVSIVEWIIFADKSEHINFPVSHTLRNSMRVWNWDASYYVGALHVLTDVDTTCMHM